MAPLAGFQLSAMPTNFQCVLWVPGTGLGPGIHPETFMDTAAPAPVRVSCYARLLSIVWTHDDDADPQARGGDAGNRGQRAN